MVLGNLGVALKKFRYKTHILENYPKINHSTRFGDLTTGVALRILGVAPKVDGEKSASSHITPLQHAPDKA